MQRDFARLGEGLFEVLVVGGGIYGAWTAYDCALRGLRVALIDRGDWAGGTSSASTKLIHGGLRYLESLRFGLVRQALRERALLLRVGPHRVTPLRFVVPLYRGGGMGRGRLRLGLGLYDLLASGSGPRSAVVAREAALRAWPGLLRGEGLECAFTYGDAQTDDARLTLELVAGAVEAGAVVCSYAASRDWLRRGERVVGALVEDRIGGDRVEVQAAVTINAAGPWAAGLPFGPALRLTKGVHLVMPALPGGDALLLRQQGDGRVVFLIPWYGRTLLGTTDSDYAGDPGAVRVEEADMAYLLKAANTFLPGADWGEGDVLGRFAGVRALQPVREGAPSSVTREWVLTRSAPGLLASVGGKLTTARFDAGRLVDRALRELGYAPRPCATGLRRLPWAPQGGAALAALEALAGEYRALGLDEALSMALARRYGTAGGALRQALVAEPALGGRLVAELPFCWGEVAHAARHEGAVTLADILRRRVPVAILAPLTDAQWQRAALLAGVALGWDAARQAQECATARAGLG